MTDDPILERISAALDLFNTGHRSEAREAFAAIWSGIGADGDPFHICILSHYMADAQEDVRDEVMWDRRALEAADRMVKERPDQAGLTVLSFYPSLHLNLADALLRSGEMDAARRHAVMARLACDALADDGYGQMIRNGVARLEARLG